MTVNQAIAKLKEKGYKNTDKRRDLLEVFADEKRYLSAKDVQEALKNKYPGLSFDTIYRNLSVFAEHGLLEETEWEGEKKFRFTCSAGHHHHHIICLTCGVTRSVDACPMDSVSTNMEGFEITGHKFEIYGYCTSCKKA
ncbi:Fur family transcriptional regulator [Fictibacillus aquaticus]|uniref:Transcriptional repressor n=1 Tax=Fictibacillus aquaticus TaxID=2021314 RepID=A0A235FBI9_9BACL|nr:Fur family transcriptional regulator [Fictibacillus aquaticus]OYD58307.1 transcriptional repressor [Fictibacillus aquaticus]